MTTHETQQHRDTLANAAAAEIAIICNDAYLTHWEKRQRIVKLLGCFGDCWHWIRMEGNDGTHPEEFVNRKA